MTSLLRPVALCCGLTCLAPAVELPRIQRLLPATAVCSGRTVQVETHDAIDNIGHWTLSGDKVRWVVDLPAGTWTASAEVAAPQAISTVAIEIGGQRLVATTRTTSGWQDYTTLVFGRCQVPTGGARTVTLLAADPADWSPINIRSVVLQRGE